MYSGLVGELLFAARAALLACVGGLAFLVHVCSLGGLLLWFLISYAYLTITPLCSTTLGQSFSAA